LRTIAEALSTVEKLYEELDSLKKNICDKCKKKFNSAVSSSRGRRSPCLAPLPSDKPTLQFTGTSSTRKAIASAVIPSVPHSDTVYSTISLPTTKPLSVPFDEADHPPKLQPDWSVVYNPDIQRTLDVHVTETLTYNQTVYDVKFSRSGEYLAVALRGGETHIYDLKTTSKR
jgi:hypothetical protein